MTGARRQPSSAPDRAAPRGPRPTVWPRLLQTLRASGSSGWWPAAILAIATAMVLVAFGTSIADVTIFGLYVAFGIALPGMLWVRFLRGHPTHIAEDLMLGLALGYCLEIAGYVVARAIGAPLVFLAWPVLTLAGFAAIPALRRHWRGDATRAPVWWSWSMAAFVAYLLVYSAGAVFTQHQLTGTDTPFVDMPFHLALIGELKHHIPPQIPYVTGVPLAYHWFFYAEAAATSWATGIEPVTLLYRLSDLPMLVAFVVLTATGARRLAGHWWTGIVAVAVTLFATTASPYAWIDNPVFDTQTLVALWISPTYTFGLTLFGATLVLFIDLLHGDARPRRTDWLLIALLVAGVAGAKASLLPLLIVGMAIVLLAEGILRRRIHRRALGALVLTGAGLAAATVVLFRGSSGGLIVGLDGLERFPVAAAVGARVSAGAAAAVTVPIAIIVVSVVLWACLWAGAFGLLARPRETLVDARVLMLLGVCAAALSAVAVFYYPGLAELYYLRGAAAAFGIVTAAGIAALVPAGARRWPLIAAASVGAVIGAVSIVAVRTLGPSAAPRLGHQRLSIVLFDLIVPLAALFLVLVAAYLVTRRISRDVPGWRGVAPVLAVAVAMGFSLASTATTMATPLTADPTAGPAIPRDGTDLARWLRDHSDPADLVATNMHCRPVTDTPGSCDARHFWVSAFAERRALVEGWAYTPEAVDLATKLHVSTLTVPFWDPALLAANDRAFSDPTAADLAVLRDRYGVRWLFADVTAANADGLAGVADLRQRLGDYAIYELRAKG